SCRSARSAGSGSTTWRPRSRSRTPGRRSNGTDCPPLAQRKVPAPAGTFSLARLSLIGGRTTVHVRKGSRRHMKSSRHKPRLDQDPHGIGNAGGRLLEQSIGREVRAFREKLGLTIAEL